jgi:mono/diheme cytochrome c family protein
MRLTPSALAIACLALSSPAAAQPKPPDGPEGGKKIFRSLCASCHGTSARGDGPLAEHLSTPPLDLTKIAARRDGAFPEELIGSFIDGREDVPLHGPRTMPVWGDSLADAVDEPAERSARITRAVGMLVEYLETIQE